MREQEQGVHDCALRLSARQGLQVDARIRAAASSHRGLDKEQNAALNHALSPNGLTVIEGRAGTGKSHTLSGIREALEESNYRVIGLAPTNSVVVDLQKDGFSQARTVHSLLWHHERQRPAGRLTDKTVLIVDEAAMVDTKTMGQLLRAAENGGSKVVLVGDDRQLSSVARGGMFAAITDRIGSAEITKVRRQNEAWDRQAAQDFAAGRFAQGLNAYEQHGRIHWSKKCDEAREALVAEWKKDTQDRIGNRFVFAYTNAEVGALNAALRQVEIARGRIESSRSVSIKTERFGIVALAKGDRVQFRSNDKPRGIVNGVLGTVKQVGDDGAVQVLSDNGGEISFSAHEKKLPELQHGYAGTIYRGQGKTLDEAYLLHTYHWRDRPSYVALTRSRRTAKLFVAREHARGLTALSRQMAHTSDRGSSLLYATAEDLRRRQAGIPQGIQQSRARGEFHQAGQDAAGKHQVPGRQPPPDYPRETIVGGSARAHLKDTGLRSDWANRLRAQTRARQVEERETLGAEHSRQSAALEKDLAAFYGPGIERDRDGLKQVHQVLKTALPARKRQAAEAQAERYRKNIADTQERWQGALTKQAAVHDQESDRLRQKHLRERAADEHKIRTAAGGPLPSGYTNDNALDADYQQSFSSDRSRGRMKARHLEERADLAREQQRARRSLREKMAKTYDIRAQEEALTLVRQQIEETGMFSRLSGRKRHLEASCASLDRSLKASLRQVSGVLDGFKERCSAQEQRLQERQDDERRRFDELLAHQPVQEQEQAPTREQARSIDPPEHRRTGPHDLGRSR